jgi:hypothetical protein
MVKPSNQAKEAREKASAAAAISKPIDQKILEGQEEEFICKCHVDALYEFGRPCYFAFG